MSSPHDDHVLSSPESSDGEDGGGENKGMGCAGGGGYANNRNKLCGAAYMNFNEERVKEKINLMVNQWEVRASEETEE